MEDKPSYRIMSVDPKMGDIDEQFALIETERGFGAPASASGMRRIVVGDELPEGSVTEITGDGIRVTPPEEDAPEFVIPLGAREGYKPPVREKTTPVDKPGDTMSPREETKDEFYELRMDKLAEAREEQGKFFDPDDAIDPDEVSELVASQFKRSLNNDKILEITQTPEGMRYMFQDEDGNISSYFQDFETSEAIRMTPEESAVNSYYELPPAPPSSALNEKLKVAGVLDLLTPFETN
jgi:hypothetical protein